MVWIGGLGILILVPGRFVEGKADLGVGSPEGKTQACGGSCLESPLCWFQAKSAGFGTRRPISERQNPIAFLSNSSGD